MIKQTIISTVRTTQATGVIRTVRTRRLIGMPPGRRLETPDELVEIIGKVRKSGGTMIGFVTSTVSKGNLRRYG